MIFTSSNPRRFEAHPGIELIEMGKLSLAPDELITLVTVGGKNTDIIRKSWGFYFGRSLNNSQLAQGFKTALVISHASNPPRLFLNIVEQDAMNDFLAYCAKYNAKIACWLDEWPITIS